MAKKYIDAQKLERHFENCIDEVRNTNGVTEDFEIALIATKNQPAADVQEVRHGKWEINCDGYYPYCSNCKEEPKNGAMSDYCPNCGCKMDGESVRKF